MANYHPVTGSRSIIDELNALRERQPAADAMDELRHTLAELEARLTNLGENGSENHSFEYLGMNQPSSRENADHIQPRWLQPDEHPMPAHPQPHFNAQSQTSTVLDSATLRQIDHRLNEISRALVAANRDKSAHEDAERLSRIEKRLQELTGQLDNSLAEQNSDILLRRLSEVAKRIDRLSETAEMPHSAIEPLARQINLLAQHLSRLIDNPIHSDFTAIESRLDKITERLAAMESASFRQSEAFFDKVEARFAELANQLDKRNSHNPDIEAIQNLERQLATITEHLSQPPSGFAELKPRLDTIERSIETNRETVLHAAQQAAESAIERLLKQGSSNDGAVVAKFSDDLKSLEVLARSAEERNDKSFQAVHEVLVKVVDRLAELEQHISQKPENSTSKQSAFSDNYFSTPRDEAAHAKPAPRKKSQSDNSVPFFDEQIGALKPAASAQAQPEKKAEIAHTDNESVLDLNSIMRRVREERNQQDSDNSPRAGKADFISAARRAAQTAAEESRKLEHEQENESGDQSSPVGNFVHRLRKPILMGMGAILLAVAGMQFAPEFFRNKSSDVPADQQALVPAIDMETTASVPAVSIEKDTASSQPLPEMPIEPQQDLQNKEVISTIEEAIAAPPASTPMSIGPTETVETEAPATTEPNTPTEFPEAIGPQSLRDAASQGDAHALFEIGNRYMEGRGVPADFTKAAELYNKAAKLNFAPAQYRLGSINEKGLGAPRDLTKAREWYELAAQQGNASAMHNLAVLYASGATGSPDNASAVRWFQEAADHNIRDSQYNLAILAAKGMGMPVDLIESYKWFALAAISGDKDAADKRDQIASALPPAQLEKAKGAVELWRAKPLDEAANALQIPDSWIEDAPITTASVDMKKAVRNIQLILQKNGYNVGSADGVMGARTRNAIKQIQKAHGLEPTGEVDPKLVDLLLSMNT